MLKGVPNFSIARVKTLLLKRSVLVAGGAIIITSLVIGVVSQVPALKNAATLATSHQPERFTELYFKNATKLPNRVTAGKRMDVSFAIANHEATTKTYQYQVTVVDETSNQTVRTSRAFATILDGKTRIIPINFTFPNVNKNYSLEIQLVNRSEVIKFRSRT